MRATAVVLFFFLLCFSAFPQQVSLTLFKSGFTSPLGLRHAGDGRLFVVEQGGKIKIIQPDGTVNATPFLDLSSQISTGNERGLLGLAFHPDYRNNGYFFVNYTKPNGNTQISRFSVDPTNADLANPNSEWPILGYTQPFSNHNGGNLDFGPDGYLYISSGDGGSGGDPDDRAQNINLLLGKILRIDVDNPSGGNNYGIPADNPFLGNPDARPEIWAYGLRNPWRFSFDLTANHIWIADVGQTSREEINRTPISEGGTNYGWRCYEGSQPFNTQGCLPPANYTFPLAEYDHSNGNCSITGGYVYRGSVYTDIEGYYFFADFCSGMIGTVDSSGNLIDHGNFSGNWSSFGEDINKELYILDLGGSIYKIEGGQIAGTPENSFENLLRIYPNPAKADITFSLNNGLLSGIKILDAEGRVILSKKNIQSGQDTFSLGYLASGVYFAKITSKKGQVAVKKIIIQ